MKETEFIEILKANSIHRTNGSKKEYVFTDKDIELCAQELEHKINLNKL